MFPNDKAHRMPHLSAAQLADTDAWLSDLRAGKMSPALGKKRKLK